MENLTVLEHLPARRKSDPCGGELQVPSLTEQQTHALADRLKAVADPTRVRMLDLLAQQPEPLCVCDITPHFPQNQPTISHHLKLLKDAGLIETERRGIWSYYWATEDGRRLLSAMTSLT
jgi:ArsR family transcriptional regulator